MVRSTRRNQKVTPPFSAKVRPPPPFLPLPSSSACAQLRASCADRVVYLALPGPEWVDMSTAADLRPEESATAANARVVRLFTCPDRASFLTNSLWPRADPCFVRPFSPISPFAASCPWSPSASLEPRYWSSPVDLMTSSSDVLGLESTSPLYSPSPSYWQDYWLGSTCSLADLQSTACSQNLESTSPLYSPNPTYWQDYWQNSTCSLADSNSTDYLQGQEYSDVSSDGQDSMLIDGPEFAVSSKPGRLPAGRVRVDDIKKKKGWIPAKVRASLCSLCSMRAPPPASD